MVNISHRVRKNSTQEQASRKSTDNQIHIDQCTFRTNKNKLLSIVMQKHHKKPKSSQFKNIGAQRQKEGRIKTNSGHLFVPHEEDRNSEFN